MPLPASTRARCIFLDTNIITNAIYGQYRPGKEDTLKYEIATEFDRLISELLRDINKVLCINEFQKKVELERAIINEFINKFMRTTPKSEFLKYGPEDLINLFNIKEILLKELSIFEEVGQLVLIKYINEKFIKSLIDLLILTKNTWTSREIMSKDLGGRIGSQDFLIATTIYYLLSTNECTELKFYTCDITLYEFLRKLSSQCSKAESKYSYDVVVYRKSSQKEQDRLVICTKLPNKQ